MELVKHSIAFTQRDVEGSVDLSCYKVRYVHRDLSVCCLLLAFLVFPLRISLPIFDAGVVLPIRF